VDECDGCVVIRKFSDLNANGRHEPGEPMLAGIHFDVAVDGEVYSAETDPTGTLRLCFAPGSAVEIREAARGLWRLTTDAEALSFQSGCGLRELWVGNALLGMPQTGRGGGHGRHGPTVVKGVSLH
jgi:hypothetical protein